MFSICYPPDTQVNLRLSCLRAKSLLPCHSEILSRIQQIHPIERQLDLAHRGHPTASMLGPGVSRVCPSQCSFHRASAISVGLDGIDRQDQMEADVANTAEE